MDNENNNHSMVTRSKKNLEEKIENKPEDNYKLEIDEHGNVSDLIDYECNESFDNEIAKIENSIDTEKKLFIVIP